MTRLKIRNVRIHRFSPLVLRAGPGQILIADAAVVLNQIPEGLHETQYDARHRRGAAGAGGTCWSTLVTPKRGQVSRAGGDRVISDLQPAPAAPRP